MHRLAVILALGFPGAALAQVPVQDNGQLPPKTDTGQSNKTSDEKKSDTLERQSGINCNVGTREKGRRMGRSPAQAMGEERGNVALIKKYATQYGVPLNLALAVAYQESRFDTCAGSPTGVRGVMQLTKRTGRSLGFDRDVNEENIEGGVKYLSQGVDRCGAANYTCLAAHYNGSSPGEQAQWRSGVQRGVPVFASLTGDGSGLAAAPQANDVVRTPVDYGDGPVGRSSNQTVTTANRAGQYLDRSGWQLGQNRDRLEGHAQAVGTAERYQDAWDQNSTIRLELGQLVNQAVDGQAMFALLLTARLIDTITRFSQTGAALSYDSRTANPFGQLCGPAERSLSPCPPTGRATMAASPDAGRTALRPTPPQIAGATADRLQALQNEKRAVPHAAPPATSADPTSPSASPLDLNEINAALEALAASARRN